MLALNVKRYTYLLFSCVVISGCCRREHLCASNELNVSDIYHQTVESDVSIRYTALLGKEETAYHQLLREIAVRGFLNDQVGITPSSKYLEQRLGCIFFLALFKELGVDTTSMGPLDNADEFKDFIKPWVQCDGWTLPSGHKCTLFYLPCVRAMECFLSETEDRWVSNLSHISNPNPRAPRVNVIKDMQKVYPDYGFGDNVWLYARGDNTNFFSLFRKYRFRMEPG